MKWTVKTCMPLHPTQSSWQSLRLRTVCDKVALKSSLLPESFKNTHLSQGIVLAPDTESNPLHCLFFDNAHLSSWKWSSKDVCILFQPLVSSSSAILKVHWLSPSSLNTWLLPTISLHSMHFQRSLGNHQDLTIKQPSCRAGILLCLSRLLYAKSVPWKTAEATALQNTRHVWKGLWGVVYNCA